MTARAVHRTAAIAWEIPEGQAQIEELLGGLAMIESYNAGLFGMDYWYLDDPAG